MLDFKKAMHSTHQNNGSCSCDVLNRTTSCVRTGVILLVLRPREGRDVTRTSDDDDPSRFARDSSPPLREIVSSKKNTISLTCGQEQSQLVAHNKTSKPTNQPTNHHHKMTKSKMVISHGVMLMALTANTNSIHAFSSTTKQTCGGYSYSSCQPPMMRIRMNDGNLPVPMRSRLQAHSKQHTELSTTKSVNADALPVVSSSSTILDDSSTALPLDENDENGRWVASSILSAAVENEREWLGDVSGKQQKQRSLSLSTKKKRDGTHVRAAAAAEQEYEQEQQKKRRETVRQTNDKQSCQQSYNRHAASDFWYNLSTLPQSSVLRDIRHPLVCITAWSTLVSVVHRCLLIFGKTKLASMMCIPSTPHSLLVSSLGLLLVFKTNSAYGRFQEGRQIWERIQSTSRDLTRMMSLYAHEMSAARKGRVQNLLAAFPYLLRHHINPRCIMMSKDEEQLLEAVPEQHRLQLEDEVVRIDDTRCLDEHSSSAVGGVDADFDGILNFDSNLHFESTDDLANFPCSPPHRHCTVDRRTLPWRLLPKKSLHNIAKSRNRALWVCDRMSAEIANVPYTSSWQNRERLTMIDHVNKLSKAVGECERIHQTLVPINYARHCLRSLTIWLLTLPFSLVQNLGLKTGLVMMALSWLMFGVYQIGYSIEDPFQGSIRLSIICDDIRREVLLESRESGLRYTAFDGDDEDEDTAAVYEGQEGLVGVDYAYAPVQ